MWEERFNHFMHTWHRLPTIRLQSPWWLFPWQLSMPRPLDWRRLQSAHVWREELLRARRLSAVWVKVQRIKLINKPCLISGGCECSSGWTGDDCSVPCKSGTFGKNCSLPCKCNQSASCDPVDGHCRCPAGYRGYDCQQGYSLISIQIQRNKFFFFFFSECVYGTFGENCEAICQCVNGCGCDPQTGNCSINGKYPAFWEG